MKIYSDVLKMADILRTVAEVPGMYVHSYTHIAKPKVRQFGWDIVTASNTRKRFKNNRFRGASDMYAASRDDHGHWFVKLYAIDPHARITGYNDVGDFHKKTFNRYAKTLAGCP